jgi:hypothetical protein
MGLWYPRYQVIPEEVASGWEEHPSSVKCHERSYLLMDVIG